MKRDDLIEVMDGESSRCILCGSEWDRYSGYAASQHDCIAAIEYRVETLERDLEIAISLLDRMKSWTGEEPCHKGAHEEIK